MNSINSNPDCNLDSDVQQVRSVDSISHANFLTYFRNLRFRIFPLRYHIMFVLIFGISLFTWGCHTEQAQSFQFCDNFNEPLDCTEPKTESDIVFLDQNLFKKENPTFEDFGNFLYFTARETPGFRLVLTKPYNGLEKQSFRSAYVAYLKYGNSTERMEGNLFQNKIVVSFHYLGALLKEEFRHKGIDKSPFQLETLGPILLEYKVVVPGMEPITKQRTVELRWK
ncbi:hypothetical protein AB3N62_08365 [Leptospira sp. WS4.C2]